MDSLSCLINHCGDLIGALFYKGNFIIIPVMTLEGPKKISSFKSPPDAASAKCHAFRRFYGSLITSNVGLFERFGH